MLKKKLIMPVVGVSKEEDVGAPVIVIEFLVLSVQNLAFFVFPSPFSRIKVLLNIYIMIIARRVESLSSATMVAASLLRCYTAPVTSPSFLHLHLYLALLLSSIPLLFFFKYRSTMTG